MALKGTQTSFQGFQHRFRHFFATILGVVHAMEASYHASIARSVTTPRSAVCMRPGCAFSPPACRGRPGPANQLFSVEREGGGVGRRRTFSELLLDHLVGAYGCRSGQFVFALLMFSAVAALNFSNEAGRW